MDLDYVLCGDCLELMSNIPDESIDMILCDPPYGTTQNKWDTIIPLDALWTQYNRIIKPNGAIVLFSAEPFTSQLVMSNKKMFKYDIIWSKSQGTDYLNANRKPLRAHENILVFYKRLPTYNPQKTGGTPYERLRGGVSEGGCYKRVARRSTSCEDGSRYPTTVQSFVSCDNTHKIHPTQKPVDLCEWLIRSYTNEGDVVLDNCMGSGSTIVAAINTGRHYIGMEMDEKYFGGALKRIEGAQQRK